MSKRETNLLTRSQDHKTNKTMKKFFFTIAIAAAFAFGMTACNNNNANEAATEDTAQAAVCEKACAHECEHNCMCADTTCKEKKCEGCENHGTENCCKAKAGEKAACESACEHKCEHAK